MANYTNILTKSQWALSKAIAREKDVENPLSNELMRKHDLAATGSLQRALKMPVNNQIAVKTDAGYLLHDIILSRWLERM